jgi:hypothetical protein
LFKTLFGRIKELTAQVDKAAAEVVGTISFHSFVCCVPAQQNFRKKPFQMMYFSIINSYLCRRGQLSWL